MLAVVDAQTLILSAHEDGRYNVTTNEDTGQPVMRRVVVHRIEDGQEDQPEGAHDGKEGGAKGQQLLRLGGVVRQAAGMPQPSLGDEDDVENDDGGGRAGNEQRLHSTRANVGDVGNRLVGRLALQMRLPVRDPDDEHGQQRACAVDASARSVYRTVPYHIISPLLRRRKEGGKRAPMDKTRVLTKPRAACEEREDPVR